MKELVERRRKKIASYKGNQLPDDVLKQAKKDGFADKYISKLLDIEEKRKLEIKDLQWVCIKYGNLFMYQVQKIVLIITLQYNGKDQDEVSNIRKS